MMSTFKNHNILNLRESFHSKKYGVFTQHAAVAILRHSATMGYHISKQVFFKIELYEENFIAFRTRTKAIKNTDFSKCQFVSCLFSMCFMFDDHNLYNMMTSSNGNIFSRCCSFVRRWGVWSLPWRWHILSIPLTTGRGTSAETCGLDDVFPSDDLVSRPEGLC